jgi:hypothetical protein
VKPVLGGLARLGDLLEHQLRPVGAARRHRRPVLLERGVRLVSERRHPERSQRIDVGGVDHHRDLARAHARNLAPTITGIPS